MNLRLMRYLMITAFITVGLFFVWQLFALNGRLTLFSILLFLGALFSYIWSKSLFKDKD